MCLHMGTLVGSPTFVWGRLGIWGRRVYFIDQIQIFQRASSVGKRTIISAPPCKWGAVRISPGLHLNSILLFLKNKLHLHVHLQHCV